VGAADETTADLRVLVDGFLDLARSAESRVKPQPAQASAGTNGGAAPDGTAAAPPPTPMPPRIYDAGSADVVPPVALHQDFPVVPRALATVMSRTQKSGIVDVLIDEKGDVERVTVRESLNPMYDTLLLTAAKRWKYRPATKAGTAVKFVKSIGIVVKETMPLPEEP
jgi:TonB family protein